MPLETKSSESGKIKIFFLDVSLWSSSKAKWTCPNLCLVIQKGATGIYEFRHVYVTQTDLQFLNYPLYIHDTDNAEVRVRDSNVPRLLRFWPIVQPHILCTVIGWVLQVHYWKVDTKKRLQHSKIRKRNYRQMQVPCKYSNTLLVGHKWLLRVDADASSVHKKYDIILIFGNMYQEI